MIINGYRNKAVRSLRDSIRKAVDNGSGFSSRNELADVIEMVLSAESFFPKRPASIRRADARFLRRKTSSSCPNCVKPKRMEDKVAAVKPPLRRYANSLDEWLEQNGQSTEEQKVVSIHELKPNIKLK